MKIEAPDISAQPSIVNLLLLLIVCSSLSVAQSAGHADIAAPIESALRSRDYDLALQLTRSQLQQSPNQAKLWTLEGVALSGLGHDREALAAYTHALSLSPDYLAALEGAAGLEYKQNSNRAIPLLNRILRLQPNNPTSHAMLAVLAYKRHDCPTAVKHFHDSGELISSQPIALTQYGGCLMTLQRPNDALPIFQTLLNLSPDDPHARYNLAVVQIDAHLGKEAIATLEPLLENKTPDADVLDLASSAYEDFEDTPNAVRTLRQAIVASPNTAKYYLDFATIAYKHSSFQVGIDMVSVGIAKIPNAAALYVARGVLYIQIEQFEKGEADFATANRLDPSQTSGSLAEGLAQIQQSNLTKALATVQSQLKVHPEDAFLHYLEAQIVTQNGVDVGTPKFKEAMGAASRAVHLKPDLALARNLLGSLYLESGQFEQSIEQSRAVLNQNPSDQVALYHLIQALRKSAKDPKGELPSLVKRLAILREESRKTEASENRYKLYEPAESGSDGVAPSSDPKN
jgi:tetratricopeptide (TPR) repeat protein